MKCLGDFGALSPGERKRLQQRSPAMIKTGKSVQPIYYSGSAIKKESGENILSIAAKNTQKLKKMQQGKKQAKKVAPPKKVATLKNKEAKKPGFFARLFGQGKKKAADKTVSSNIVRPGNSKVFSKPVAKASNKKVAVKSFVEKKGKKSVKAWGMNGNYALGDFGSDF